MSGSDHRQPASSEWEYRKCQCSFAIVLPSVVGRVNYSPVARLHRAVIVASRCLMTLGESIPDLTIEELEIAVIVRRIYEEGLWRDAMAASTWGSQNVISIAR